MADRPPTPFLRTRRSWICSGAIKSVPCSYSLQACGQSGIKKGSSCMPVKPLPPDADLNHLKYQAKDLIKACTRGDLQAARRRGIWRRHGRHRIRSCHRMFRSSIWAGMDILWFAPALRLWKRNSFASLVRSSEVIGMMEAGCDIEFGSAHRFGKRARRPSLICESSRAMPVSLFETRVEPSTRRSRQECSKTFLVRQAYT